MSFSPLYIESSLHYAHLRVVSPWIGSLKVEQFCSRCRTATIPSSVKRVNIPAAHTKNQSLEKY